MTKPEIFYTGPIVKRQDAKAQGLKRYFTGKPCRRGHVDQRYLDGSCVSCAPYKIRREKVKVEIKEICYDGDVVNRDDARLLGHTYFFTGDPCPNGHISQRYVSNGSCVKCGLERSKANKERKSEYNKEYRNRNRDKLNEASRKYYRENKEDLSIKSSKYRKDNWEKILEYKRNDYKMKPDLYAARARRRRAREKGAEGTHTADDVKFLLECQNNKCAEPTCRKDISDGYHVDHIMPLALGGSDWPDNLQCLCPECNTRKGAMHPDDWEKLMGR